MIWQIQSHTEQNKFGQKFSCGIWTHNLQIITRPTELSHYLLVCVNQVFALLILEMNKVQHVKWCMKQRKPTLEISYPTNSCLAELVELGDDLEVLGSKTHWEPFLAKFILFSVTFWQISDFLILKNSNWKDVRVIVHGALHDAVKWLILREPRYSLPSVTLASTFTVFKSSSSVTKTKIWKI